MYGFRVNLGKVTQKGQDNHYVFHYSAMRNDTPQICWKTIRETVFCDNAKTQSENLIKPVENGWNLRCFRVNGLKRTRKPLRFHYSLR